MGYIEYMRKRIKCVYVFAYKKEEEEDDEEEEEDPHFHAQNLVFVSFEIIGASFQQVEKLPMHSLIALLIQ